MLTGLLRLPSPYVLVACGGLILLIGMGMRNTFGLFLEPMSLDLDLPRHVYSLAIAIQMLVWGASQPIFGAAATTHSGTIKLSGVETVWVVLDAGQVTIQVEQPGF